MNTTLNLQIWECDSELTKLMSLNKVIVTLSRRGYIMMFFLDEGEILRTRSQLHNLQSCECDSQLTKLITLNKYL